MTANDTTPYLQVVTLGTTLGTARRTDTGEVRFTRSTLFDVMRAAEEASARYEDNHSDYEVGEPCFTVATHPVNGDYVSYGWTAVGHRR